MSRILIVDDDPDFADTTAAVLNADGHDVFTAFDGRAALERIAQLRPHLLVVDVMMPALSGPGMLNRLDEFSYGHSLPVIVVSGLDEGNVREYTTRYDVFLHKPFHATALVDAVRSLLASP